VIAATHLGVLSGDGAGIGLPADLDTLVIGEVDVFYKGVGVEGA
jgi:hypothetical protein